MASEAAAEASAEADHDGARALALIDAVIAAKPEKNDHALAAAVERLCAWRRGMWSRREGGAWGADRERDLGTLNGTLSLVLAIQFPLGEVRWDELEGARTVLAGLLERAAD